MRSLIAVTRACSIAMLILAPAIAQAQQIFITSDQTVSTTAGGNDIFVGKDNLAGFNTLPGVITLTISPTGATSVTPTGTLAPDSLTYFGLHNFGNHQVDTSGTVIRATGHDSSVTGITGGFLDTIDNYDASLVNVTSGTVSNIRTHDGSTANISGGTVDTSVHAYDHSTVNISGGTIPVGVIADSHNASSIRVTGGNVNAIIGYDSSTIGVSAGTVSSAGANGNSVVTISGGNVHNAGGAGFGKIDIVGGTVFGTNVTGNAVTNISGGQVTTAYTYNSGTTNISGGTVTNATISDANLIITGGIVGEVDASGGLVTITGGNVTEIQAAFNATVDISGGTIGTNTIRVYDTSTIHLLGSGLAFSSQGTGTDINGDYTAYSLMGLLQDGQSISGVSLFDYSNVGQFTGGGSGLTFGSAGNATAPEPGSLVVLTPVLLGGIAVSRRRRV